MLAAQRGRALAAGAPLSIDRDNDKNPVVALREIADGTISLDVLQNDLVKGHQRLVEPEEPEEEPAELMREPEWARLSEQERGEEDIDGELAADEVADEDEIDEPSPEDLTDPFVGEAAPFE